LGRLTSPFLRSIRFEAKEEIDWSDYPFRLQADSKAPFEIAFTSPVTIIVGENGSGKSTILEAIARLCGFGTMGGNRNYPKSDEDVLSPYLRASWLPKVMQGFFMRAESFMPLIWQMDSYAITEDGPLEERSHGEAYARIFGERIRGQGIYILDEPEAALSPARQLELLCMLRQAEETGNAQFVIATHSPLMMAYPGATVLQVTTEGILERSYTTTEHFRLLKRFYADPEQFMKMLFEEDKIDADDPAERIGGNDY
jgi:predicted ATPase